MHRSSSTLSNFKWRLKDLKHKTVVPQKTTLFTGTETQKNKIIAGKIRPAFPTTQKQLQASMLFWPILQPQTGADRLTI